MRVSLVVRSNFRCRRRCASGLPVRDDSAAGSTVGAIARPGDPTPAPSQNPRAGAACSYRTTPSSSGIAFARHPSLLGLYETITHFRPTRARAAAARRLLRRSAMVPDSLSTALMTRDSVAAPLSFRQTAGTVSLEPEEQKQKGGIAKRGGARQRPVSGATRQREVVSSGESHAGCAPLAADSAALRAGGLGAASSRSASSDGPVRPRGFLRRSATEWARSSPARTTESGGGGAPIGRVRDCGWGMWLSGGPACSGSILRVEAGSRGVFSPIPDQIGQRRRDRHRIHLFVWLGDRVSRECRDGGSARFARDDGFGLGIGGSGAVSAMDSADARMRVVGARAAGNITWSPVSAEARTSRTTMWTGSPASETSPSSIFRSSTK